LICLESVFRNDYPHYKVVVCDNGSKDNSLSYIKSWADGMLDAFSTPEFHLRNYMFPPVPKPIKFKDYNKSAAEMGGDIGDKESKLILIQTDDNLGFAGGNNVGLRYALSRGDFEYVWLLNNDTIIRSDTLSHLVKRIGKSNDIGMCGSTLLYYDKQHIIQAYGGGIYNKWFGFSRHIGAFNDFNKPIDQKSVETKMDYVVGSSMIIPKKFLEDVGLMSEEYFLYFEEIDWATRAKKNYTLAYAPESIVYHKEGISSGAGNNPKQKSAYSDYFFIRSRLLYTRKFYPFVLPTVYLGLLLTIFNRIVRRQYKRVVMIIKIIFNRDYKINSLKKY